MGKILQLDEHLSNKIAAGEVVERPASVVKELVENAVDANASIIQIELEEAGLSKIRVLDNGDGMDNEDCLTAFQRHATSKIKDENDLFRIRTLGFRGEALPSIASVSILELTTSTGTDAGMYVKLQGGHVVEQKASNARKGTDIVVSQLFFNTPARLKYLKTIHTELGNVTDVVYRLALAHPSISFRLNHNGKTIFQSNGTGNSLHVLAAIYGMNVAKKMIPIHLNSLDFKVTGYIGLPEITRASKSYISTIINGRFVKNYTVLRAIQAGYHTLLPIGRYPIAFLQVEMDPILVDVNVHPTKLEVRLSKEDELYDLITEGVKNAFQKLQLIPEANVTPKHTKQTYAKDEQQVFSLQNPSTTQKQEQAPVLTREPSPNFFVKVEEDNEVIEDQILPHVVNNPNGFIADVDHNSESITHVEDESATKWNVAKSEPRIPTLYPIGQMHGTYILAQNESGLYLIDQHAAQERINYEYFFQKLGNTEREVQDLLVPLTMEFSPEEYLFLEGNLEEFKKVGVFLEPFGHQTYIIRSHPTWFPRGDEHSIIEEMMEQITTSKSINIAKLREEAAIMMSCKASIKANHHLRHDEMVSLLQQLRQANNPFTCPHGRPILIHYSTYELEKMFKRIM
ncbi:MULTISPECIES: DNA mismatch repair endonuclease MutL [Bacillus]|uniref:DNA mismatch repair endonuclease MutL n=1 Tax=Bacillus TaxID=1386 RepID=UPI000BB87E3A|nr:MULTISPECIES: DNA mismatch repair endonuclease MutL [Bacillus]